MKWGEIYSDRFLLQKKIYFIFAGILEHVRIHFEREEHMFKNGFIISILFFVISIVCMRTVAAQSLKEDNYLIGAGDKLEITVWAGEKKETSLTGYYVVFSSGYIEMPLIGKVTVEDLALEEVSTVLEEHLGARFIREPKVTLSIKEYGSKTISILGAVDTPGSYRLERRTTLAEALARAEGINELEKGAKQVKVTRADGEKLVFDLEKVMEGVAVLEMQAGDVIFVTDGLYVIVNGRVEHPGTIPWREGMTITEAIAEAGGALPAAHLREVFLLRGEQRIPVNVKWILQGKEADVPLENGDKVFLEERVF